MTPRPQRPMLGEIGSDADAPLTHTAIRAINHPAEAVLVLARNLRRAAAELPRRSQDEDPPHEFLVAAARLLGLDPPLVDYARREARELERIVRAIGQDAGVQAFVREQRDQLRETDKIVGKPGPRPERSADTKRRAELERAYRQAEKLVKGAKPDGRTRRRPRLTAHLHAKLVGLSESQVKREANRLGLHFHYSRSPRRPD